MLLAGKKIGFALTGSFCTIGSAIIQIGNILSEGAEVTAIISSAVDTMDTRFGAANDIKQKLEDMTEKKIIRTICEAEPIGPKGLFDLLVVAPVTGNTLAKMALGITDTTVTMAVKSHLRNNNPVLLGISTNDGLGNSAKNIGTLLNTRHIYFIPFSQDDPIAKEKSLVFKSDMTISAILKAMEGKQVQPLIS